MNDVMTGFRVDPHNAEAEQGLLGCLLTDNRAYDLIAGITKPEHFYIPAHQSIFREIDACLSNGKAASPVLLKTTFNDHPDLESVGGGYYLAELAGQVISTINAVEYAQTIRELFVRRELITAAKLIITRAETLSILERGTVLSDAEAMITKLGAEPHSSCFTGGEAVQKARHWAESVRSGKVKPFMTGLATLDEKVCGLYPGRLYILAGRPGMGKTALGLNIADNISRTHPAVFISIEMPVEEIGMRLDACRTGISVNRLQTASSLTPREQIALQESMRDVVTRNLIIENSSGIDIQGIKSLARMHRRKIGQFALVIDYLGLISMDPTIRNRVHQIEEITTNLKRLSKELDIPIILLCQLSRAVEGRDDKRPGLSDLRDSGSIEQDADVVMFVYREEYYLSRSQASQGAKESEEKYQRRLADNERKAHDAQGKAEIIIAKNRQGMCGTVTLNFNGQRQRFYE